VDVFYLGITAVLFILTLLLVRICDRV